MPMYYRTSSTNRHYSTVAPKSITYYERCNIPSDIQELFDKHNANAPWEKETKAEKPEQSKEQSEQLAEVEAPRTATSQAEAIESSKKVKYSKIDITRGHNFDRIETGSMTDLSDFSVGCYSDEEESDKKDRELRNQQKMVLRARRQSQFFAKYCSNVQHP